MKNLSFVSSMRIWLLSSISLVIAVWFCVPNESQAAYFLFPEYPQYEATEFIDAPSLQRYYFGQLKDFPHTYTFLLQSSTTLPVTLWVPDTPEAAANLNAIIVRKLANGSVAEVARLDAAMGKWETWHEWWGNDDYRIGPAYTGELGPGDYLLEVNSPRNEGKYVLVVGDERISLFGDWWRNLTRVAAVKRFFGKPFVSIFTAPVVFVPLLVVITTLSFGFWWRGRRRVSVVERPHDSL